MAYTDGGGEPERTLDSWATGHGFPAFSSDAVPTDPASAKATVASEVSSDAVDTKPPTTGGFPALPTPANLQGPGGAGRAANAAPKMTGVLPLTGATPRVQILPGVGPNAAASQSSDWRAGPGTGTTGTVVFGGRLTDVNKPIGADNPVVAPPKQTYNPLAEAGDLVRGGNPGSATQVLQSIGYTPQQIQDFVKNNGVTSEVHNLVAGGNPGAAAQILQSQGVGPKTVQAVVAALQGGKVLPTTAAPSAGQTTSDILSQHIGYGKPNDIANTVSALVAAGMTQDNAVQAVKDAVASAKIPLGPNSTLPTVTPQPGQTPYLGTSIAGNTKPGMVGTPPGQNATLNNMGGLVNPATGTANNVSGQQAPPLQLPAAPQAAATTGAGGKPGAAPQDPQALFRAGNYGGYVQALAAQGKSATEIANDVATRLFLAGALKDPQTGQPVKEMSDTVVKWVYDNMVVPMMQAQGQTAAPFKPIYGTGGKNTTNDGKPVNDTNDGKVINTTGGKPPADPTVYTSVGDKIVNGTLTAGGLTDDEMRALADISAKLAVDPKLQELRSQIAGLGARTQAALTPLLQKIAQQRVAAAAREAAQEARMTQRLAQTRLYTSPYGQGELANLQRGLESEQQGFDTAEQNAITNQQAKEDIERANLEAQIQRLLGQQGNHAQEAYLKLVNQGADRDLKAANSNEANAIKWTQTMGVRSDAHGNVIYDKEGQTSPTLGMQRLTADERKTQLTVMVDLMKSHNPQTAQALLDAVSTDDPKQRAAAFGTAEQAYVSDGMRKQDASTIMEFYKKYPVEVAAVTETWLRALRSGDTAAAAAAEERIAEFQRNPLYNALAKDLQIADNRLNLQRDDVLSKSTGVVYIGGKPWVVDGQPVPTVEGQRLEIDRQKMENDASYRQQMVEIARARLRAESQPGKVPPIVTAMLVAETRDRKAAEDRYYTTDPEYLQYWQQKYAWQNTHPYQTYTVPAPKPDLAKYGYDPAKYQPAHDWLNQNGMAFFNGQAVPAGNSVAPGALPPAPRDDSLDADVRDGLQLTAQQVIDAMARNKITDRAGVQAFVSQYRDHMSPDEQHTLGQNLIDMFK